MKISIELLFFSLIISITSYAQTTVTGIVRDQQGLPIQAATTVVKGTSLYAITDSTGRFSLAAPKVLPFTLEVSYAGLKSKEIEIYELQSEPFEITLLQDNVLEEVVVTSRRRSEVAQEIPIAVSVVSGAKAEDAGAFNVNRVKELIPSVQLYSSNPRNTTLNIRGLGSTFGLTNDGIDPGVGFYVDGVYYARPAATALDFIDVDRIEVLRGPQGTLFGKNTTAGAFNITSRAAKFVTGANFEVSYGNYGYVQAKASVTGPLIAKKLAARVSFSGTQRDGIIYNVATDKYTNDINNLGFRGQLLFTPTDKINITLIGDATRQRPDGYAQVVAGVVPTLRPAYRQFEQIIADLNYNLPTRNPFDRVIDHNTSWRSNNDLGGVSLNIDAKIGKGTLTSTTAWRYWFWDPSNDRDFTGIAVLSKSQATSKHNQWSQEVRYAGDIFKKLSGVVGVFAIAQDLSSDPVQIEESGEAQWRFSQSSTSDLWKTPGLFEGYGIATTNNLKTFSGAVFGQLDWEIFNRFHVLPGIRFNYDKKDVDYNRQTYGGLQTTDPALIALKNAVYTNQSFKAKVNNNNISGQLTLSYKASKAINAFLTYSTNYKPVGVNLGGLPTASGQTLIELAQVKPEHVNHFEAGIKTNPTSNSTFNFAIYDTEIKDYQTNVQTAEVGVNRGYLANAEKVRVRGFEFDLNTRISRILAFYGALAYTDGKYVSFKNAPVPLEETGGPSAFKDVSGGQLPGISKWSGSLGGELTSNSGKLLGSSGKFFLAVDTYYKSDFSSSPSPSKYLNVKGYFLLNARMGFRATTGLSVIIWSRNLLNKDYFEQLLPAAGNAGHYAAVLGDPRTFGTTLRYSF